MISISVLVVLIDSQVLCAWIGAWVLRERTITFTFLLIDLMLVKMLVWKKKIENRKERKKKGKKEVKKSV